MTWEIGAFARPWSRFPFEEALAGIAAAGYPGMGLLGGSADTSFDLAKRTAEDDAALLAQIARHGLSVNMACLSVPHDIDEETALASVRTQIDHGKRLGVRYLMTFGADRESEYARWYRVTAAAAAYAEPLGIGIVFKPHGGCTAASEELKRCLDEIAHPNATIWFDAGNIVYYTENDPVTELLPVIGSVSGFCAKDCGGYHTDVMIPFGAGKVDFRSVFAELAAAGFDGPVMLECCGGKEFDEITASARANREFLETVFASL